MQALAELGRERGYFSFTAVTGVRVPLGVCRLLLRESWGTDGAKDSADNVNVSMTRANGP